jgi:hypothetical protein
VRRKTLTAAALATFIGASLSATAIAQAPAGQTFAPIPVRAGAWFNVSVHGLYEMRWGPGTLRRSCGPGITDSYVTGEGSETIKFATVRPVRAYAIEVILSDKPRHSSFAALFFKQHFVATGTKLGPNDLTPLSLPTPATYTRSLTGTWADCGQTSSTLAPSGCGTFATPGFTTRIAEQAVTEMNLEGFPHSGRTATACRYPQDFPPSLGEDTPPNFRTLPSAFGVTEKCRPPTAELKVRIGGEATCRILIPDDRVCPLSGKACTERYGHETITVTLRRAA